MEKTIMTDITFIEILSTVTPWFDNPGMVGGIAGAGIGVLGGIYGTVLGICSPKGKAKVLVFTMHWCSLLLGVLLLIGGITALVSGQPYRVWYPIILPGAILTLLMVCFTPMVFARYRQAEHRQLHAEEFRRG